MQIDSVELTALTRHGCVLRGYPNVTTTGHGLSPLAATRGDSRVPAKPRSVLLRYGEHAYFVVGVNAGCLHDPQTYDGLTIHLPGGTERVTLSTHAPVRGGGTQDVRLVTDRACPPFVTPFATYNGLTP
jgi:hypothetical protein